MSSINSVGSVLISLLGEFKVLNHNENTKLQNQFTLQAKQNMVRTPLNSGTVPIIFIKKKPFVPIDPTRNGYKEKLVRSYRPNTERVFLYKNYRCLTTF